MHLYSKPSISQTKYQQQSDLAVFCITYFAKVLSILQHYHKCVTEKKHDEIRFRLIIKPRFKILETVKDPSKEGVFYYSF